MERRNPNRSPLSTNLCDNSIYNLQRKSETILKRTSVSILAIVDIIMDESVKEISIRAMDLNAIKTSLDCVLCSTCKLLDHFSDIGLAHSLGLNIWLFAVLLAEEGVGVW